MLIDCDRRMFRAFGSVPRKVLYAHMKAVVTERDA
jgi:transposase